MVTSPRIYADALYSATASLDENSAKKVLKSFTERMHSKGLSSLLPKILDELPGAARDAEGIKEIHVRSSSPLSKKDIDQLLASMDIKASKAEINVIEDPEVTTGFSAYTVDMRIEHTLSRRLNALRKRLH